MRTARVVAAVVRRERRILITRRHDGAERGGLWEFPGGKVEPGEEEPDALRREIREELGCAVQVGRLLLRHSHGYPDLAVELAFYECEIPAGEEPRALGVAEMEWAVEGTLSGRHFCEADVPVLAALERPPPPR
jgi:8-oxo-dGTP diphosphatase